MKSPFSSMKSVRSFSYGKRLRPARDWFVLLTCFGIALLLSVAWNIWLFSQVSRGQQIGNATSTPPVQINVDQVKTIFTARDAERARYVGQYHFVDPSR